jgi:hypothetical protein
MQKWALRYGCDAPFSIMNILYFNFLYVKTSVFIEEILPSLSVNAESLNFSLWSNIFIQNVHQFYFIVQYEQGCRSFLQDFRQVLSLSSTFNVKNSWEKCTYTGKRYVPSNSHQTTVPTVHSSDHSPRQCLSTHSNDGFREFTLARCEETLIYACSIVYCTQYLHIRRNVNIMLKTSMTIIDYQKVAKTRTYILQTHVWFYVSDLGQ